VSGDLKWFAVEFRVDHFRCIKRFIEYRGLHAEHSYILVSKICNTSLRNGPVRGMILYNYVFFGEMNTRRSEATHAHPFREQHDALSRSSPTAVPCIGRAYVISCTVLVDVRCSTNMICNCHQLFGSKPAIAAIL
jgi:hypothetical protein